MNDGAVSWVGQLEELTQVLLPLVSDLMLLPKPFPA
jgi:hypothetical protein